MADLRTLQIDAVVEEFRALRAELTTRIGKQQDITNFAIAILVGLLAVAKAVGGTESPGDTLVQLRMFFPWISIVLSSFSLMTLDHEMNIAHLSAYVYTRLRPQMEAARLTSSHASGLWEWNAYRAGWQQHTGVSTALTSTAAIAKYVITIFPNMLLTAAYWCTRPIPGVPLNWAWAIYAISIVLLILVLLTAVHTSRIYLLMKYRRPVAHRTATSG